MIVIRTMVKTEWYPKLKIGFGECSKNPGKAVEEWRISWQMIFLGRIRGERVLYEEDGLFTGVK